MAFNVEERLKKILVNQLSYTVSMEQVHEDTPLYGRGLGLNSLEMVSLVVGLENEFDIFFEADEVAASVGTFGSLLQVVRQKLSQDGAASHYKKGS